MLPKNVTHSIRLKLGRLAVSTEQLLKLQCSITISSTLESFVFLVFYLRSKDEPFISLMYDIRGFLSPKGLKNDYLCQIYTPQIVVCQLPNNGCKSSEGKRPLILIYKRRRMPLYLITYFYLIITEEEWSQIGGGSLNIVRPSLGANFNLLVSFQRYWLPCGLCKLYFRVVFTKEVTQTCESTILRIIIYSKYRNSIVLHFVEPSLSQYNMRNLYDGEKTFQNINVFCCSHKLIYYPNFLLVESIGFFLYPKLKINCRLDQSSMQKHMGLNNMKPNYCGSFLKLTSSLIVDLFNPFWDKRSSRQASFGVLALICLNMPPHLCHQTHHFSDLETVRLSNRLQLVFRIKKMSFHQILHIFLPMYNTRGVLSKIKLSENSQPQARINQNQQSPQILPPLSPSIHPPTARPSPALCRQLPPFPFPYACSPRTICQIRNCGKGRLCHAAL
ncbi:hypothetical protein VP01_881g2 [Puccinia sorghi]|uniref:Uncharacterized protein n=1 Tax=Puccinia sorghi TaxID=27349 RepID=A0A0L6U8B2_9BASI|nr:hypothetical protein VP01_881g2 [Puccinia sorghi]